MYAVIRGLNETHSRDWMGRYIMYFLLFYDAGGAYQVAEANPKDFWGEVKRLAMIKETKRGTERRHFRGKNALSALVNLERFQMTPGELLGQMYGVDHNPTYTAFYGRMTNLFAGTQFGPYFIWKLYDIFNVCLDMPITLSVGEALKYMPDEPRKAAEAIFGNFDLGLGQVVGYISQFDHPVRPGKCGLAEAETVLCMLKGAFLTKSHQVGDDIDEKVSQLKGIGGMSYLPPPVSGLYKLGDLVV